MNDQNLPFQANSFSSFPGTALRRRCLWGGLVVLCFFFWGGSVSDASFFSQETEEKPTAVETVPTAERIANLQNSIEEEEKQLAELQKKLQDRQKEFEEAGTAFRQLESELEALNRQMEDAQDRSASTEVERLSEQLANLEEKRQLARDRFQLAIEMKQNLEEQIRVLSDKLQKDRQALEKLLNPEAAAERETPTAPTASPQNGETPADAPTPPVEEETSPNAPPTPAIPGLPMPEEVTVESTKEEEPPSEEWMAAQEEVAEATTIAEKARQSLSEVEERIAALDKTIELEQKAREASRKQADNASQTLQMLHEELQTKLQQEASEEAVRKIREQIKETQTRFREARDALTKHSEQLDRLQDERVNLLGEKAEAQSRLEQARQEAEKAQDKLKEIENPFSPRNMLEWLMEKGPRLILIVIVVLVLRFVIVFVAKRIVKAISKGDTRGTRKERENRANTLVSVFQNTAMVALFAGAIIMMLELVGIPVAPLLGGAAVIGLAIAFGAQNLVKDYFYGFMILLENQYGVNDVVSIGGEIGFVERITLRMTVLRNFDAVVFVPHGQVTTVSNLTHKWSRAVFDLGVSYKEDVDEVMALIVQLGKELREDPDFAEFILDDLEMLGLDGFADSAVMIKFFIKTQPLKQWDVKRELLRRIKKAFDERGIEIPFPHRTVYHRYEQDYLPPHLLNAIREKGQE